MKMRNKWKYKNRLIGKFSFRLCIGFINVLMVEIDISRNYYMFTLFNFTIQNR